MAGSIPSGIARTASRRIVAYSECPPSVMTPLMFFFSQVIKSPRSHRGQEKQCPPCHPEPTIWPTFQRFSDSGTSTTRPTISWPERRNPTVSYLCARIKQESLRNKKAKGRLGLTGNAREAGRHKLVDDDRVRVAHTRGENLHTTKREALGSRSCACGDPPQRSKHIDGVAHLDGDVAFFRLLVVDLMHGKQVSKGTLAAIAGGTERLASLISNLAPFSEMTAALYDCGMEGILLFCC